MKAALITEFGAPLKVQDIPEPQVGLNDVLVKVKVCGVCYSDVKIWKGRSPMKPSLPHVLGHEVTGTVAKTGANVTGLDTGDRVTIYLYDTCDRCAACRTGHDNHCISMGPLVGFNRPGGFAEYISVPSKNVFKIPPELDFAQAALLPDAVITPYHAIVEKARVGFNETAMLVGMGGLALSALQVLKLLGARVIAVSRTDGKLEMASKFGADATINATKTDVVQEAKRLTDGYGVDYVFDFVVSPDTVAQDIRATKRGGKVVFMTYDVEPVPIRTTDMMLGLMSIQSTRGGTRQNLRDLIRLASEGKIKSIVTDKYDLNGVSSALTALSQGQVTGRVTLQL